jgi:hypothetical protein
LIGSLGLYNVRYERANVLFNTAAFMSQIAASQNRNTDEGIKIAGKYFQVRKMLMRIPNFVQQTDFA